VSQPTSPADDAEIEDAVDAMDERTGMDDPGAVTNEVSDDDHDDPDATEPADPDDTEGSAPTG